MKTKNFSSLILLLIAQVCFSQLQTQVELTNEIKKVNDFNGQDHECQTVESGFVLVRR